MGQSDESLAPERRAAYYRSMAAEALRLAQTAIDEGQKASYLDIAARWNILAGETERRIGRNVGTRKSDKDSGEPQADGDHR